MRPAHLGTVLLAVSLGLPTLLPGVAVAGKAKPETGWEPANNEAVDAFNKGVGALNVGDARSAETSFRRALKQDSECGMCSSALGQAHLLQNRPAEAQALFVDLMERHPDRVEVHIMAASSAFAAQDFETAVALAQAGRARFPMDPAMPIQLVRPLVRLGRDAEARAVADDVDQKGARGLAACLDVAIDSGMSDGEIDIARWELCVAEGPEDLVAELHTSVARLTGRAEEGALFIAEGLDQNNVWSQVLQAMGNQDWELALAHLREVVDAEPDNNSARVNLAICLHNLERTDEALAALERSRKSKAYIRVAESGNYTGVLTDRARKAQIDTIRYAFILHVALLVNTDRSGEARSLFDEVRADLDHPPTVQLAEAMVMGSEGELDGAWKQLLEVAEASKDGGNAAFVARTLFQIDETEVPKAASALLASDDMQLSAYNTAVDDAKAGDYAACLEELLSFRGNGRSDLAVAFRDLRYQCAVMAQDWPAAWAALASEASWQVLPPGIRLRHAKHFQDNGQTDEALSLLEDFGPVEDTELETHVRSRHLDVHRERGELEEAVSIALEGPTQDWAVYNLASQFARQEDHAKVVELWESVAPLSDPELAAQARNMHVMGLLDTDRLDEAIALLGAGPSKGWARYNVASDLSNLGRFDEAISLLEGRCAEFSEPARCQEILDAMREHQAR